LILQGRRARGGDGESDGVSDFHDPRIGVGGEIRRQAGLCFVRDSVSVHVGAGAKHDVNGVVHTIVIKVVPGQRQLNDAWIKGAIFRGRQRIIPGYIGDYTLVLL
jgi:hypothetical protein